MSDASSMATSAVSLFFSWVFTPIGATLTLLVILLGGGSLLGRVMGWSGRIIKVMLTVTAALFFAWMITGILSAMGIPVRDWLLQVGSYIPVVLDGFARFLGSLVTVAE